MADLVTLAHLIYILYINVFIYSDLLTSPGPTWPGLIIVLRINHTFIQLMWLVKSLDKVIDIYFPYPVSVFLCLDRESMATVTLSLSVGLSACLSGGWGYNLLTATSGSSSHPDRKHSSGAAIWRTLPAEELLRHGELPEGRRYVEVEVRGHVVLSASRISLCFIGKHLRDVSTLCVCVCVYLEPSQAEMARIVSMCVRVHVCTTLRVCVCVLSLFAYHTFAIVFPLEGSTVAVACDKPGNALQSEAGRQVTACTSQWEIPGVIPTGLPHRRRHYVNAA